MRQFPKHTQQILSLAALLCCPPAVAAAATEGSVSAGPMTIELLGGLALFLFGIDQMTVALKAVAGDRMKLVLA
jgi:phosphate:Na+ symporter